MFSKSTKQEFLKLIKNSNNSLTDEPSNDDTKF